MNRPSLEQAQAVNLLRCRRARIPEGLASTDLQAERRV